LELISGLWVSLSMRDTTTREVRALARHGRQRIDDARTSRSRLGGMTAQIGDDGLDLLGDPLPELLTDLARGQPQPGGEWVNLKNQLGFRSIQRLAIRGVAGSVVVVTWPAELAVQARYLYGGGLGSLSWLLRSSADGQ
jgi:hypothetical protein